MLLLIPVAQVMITLWIKRRRPRIKPYKTPPPTPPPSPVSLPTIPEHGVFSRQNSLVATSEEDERFETQQRPITVQSPQFIYDKTVMPPVDLYSSTVTPSCGCSCINGRKCGWNKNVLFTNTMKDKNVDLWIRPSNKFYLSGFGCKSLTGQIERTGPDELIQTVRLSPGDSMKIQVETFSYFVSALIDDKQLWFNRRFFTDKDIIFYGKQLKRLRPVCKSFKELME